MKGEELRALRTKYNVTQEELADFLGYTSKGKPNRSQICRLENGHATINSRVKMLIEVFFNERSNEVSASQAAV